MNELEERARTLLHAAAETVEVRPAAPVVVRRKRVWPLVAAAAVVVALLLAVPLLLPGGEPDRTRLEPVGPASTIRVPQTYLMTTEQATATLERSGLRVTYGTTGLNECELVQDRVVSSDPGVGEQLPPGATVRIDRPGGPAGNALCAYSPDAIALLDLARFRESRLAFAPTVRLWRDGEVTATLTAEQAASGEWGEGSPLDVLVAALDDTRRFGPVLSAMNDDGDQFACGEGDPPAELRDRPSLVVMVGDQVDGVFGCAWVRLYRDDERRISDVVAATTFDY